VHVTLLSYLIIFIITDKKVIKLKCNSNKDKRVIFKEKVFLPILCGIHPFATRRRGNLSNVTEGIVGIWLTEWLRGIIVFYHPIWRFRKYFVCFAGSWRDVRQSIGKSIENKEEHWGGWTTTTTKRDWSEYLGFCVHRFFGKEIGQGRLVE